MKSYILILLTVLSACGKAPTAQVAKIENKNTAQICGEFFSTSNGSIQQLQGSTWVAVPNGDYENDGCSYTVLDARVWAN